jgi:hypothetical protein
VLRSVSGRENEGVHQARHGRLRPAPAPVELPRRGVRLLGQHPRLAAPELAPPLEEQVQEASPDSTTLMGRSHCHLVDEQLRRLVRVDVVDRRGHPDHGLVVDGDSEVVPGITKELAAPTSVHGMVKYVGSHPLENGAFVGSEEANV